MKLIRAISPVMVACGLATQAQAAAIPVPNGSFEALFKPGSTTITADTGAGWTQGVGAVAAMEGGVATYSDATTGAAVDVPGWVNAPAAGAPPDGGWAPPYGWPKGSGTIDRNNPTPYGSYYYSGNPTVWGNPYGAAIESAAPLATVGSGRTYTISMTSNNELSPAVLDLLANGVILTPTSSGTAPDGLWTLHTKTYAAASLVGVVGQSLKIRVGWALGANGGQGHLDNVQLADDLPADTTAPTLTSSSFVDNKGGGPIIENEKVTYTVTFSEAMNASTVNAADFENASATAVTVNSVTPTENPAVFLVMATPAEPGTLRLQVKADATLTDLDGNALVTTAAIPDNTTITVNITPLSTACDILTFGPGAVIDQGSKTITMTVPFGTNLASVAPTFTISALATCARISGEVPSPNFSTANPMTYTVIAEDSNVSKNYTVTVVMGPANTDCDMLTFGPDAVIDQGSKTITMTVPFGTNLANIAPDFTISALATCNRVSGAVPSPNFSAANPMTYTVTAQDINVSKNYTVTVVVTGPSTACDITDFGTNVTGSHAAITNTSPTTGTIVWTVPSGTTVATLAPTYTLSANATCPQPNPGTPTPVFSIGSPVPYVVTAQDGVTKRNYAVTAALVPTESALIWNIAGGGDWDFSTPNWLGQTSATVMPFFNTLNAIFNKTEGGTINIAAGMEPASTTVSAAAGTYTFSGSPLTTGSLTKSGNGNLTITIANNSYSGGTTINAGQLKMDVMASAALGTGPVTLNGGTLYLERINAINDLIVNGGNLYPDNGFGDSWGGTVTLNSNLIIQGPGYATMTFSGSISGVGGLTLNGQGPVVLQVANSYEGPTSVAGCTLTCNHIDALGSGALSISSGAKVKLNYTGEHNIATLTLGGVPQASGTHGSVLSGADHTSDLYFDAASVGTVRVPPSSAADMLTFSFGALGAATIGDTTVTLEVPFGTNRAALAPTYTVSLGATCVPASGTTLNFTGAQTYTVTAEDGTQKAYTVTVTEAVLPDLFTWANSGNGNWNDSANWTNELAIVTTPLSGGRSSYTLNFTAAGTYTATNNLSAGFQLNQLNFGAKVTLAGNSLAFVANGATLPEIKQNSANAVIIPNPLDLGANTTFGGTGNGEVQFTATSLITGAGSLTKNGPGTLKISNVNNTYAGGTIINTGRLYMDLDLLALGTGPITLNGGEIFLWRARPTNPLIVNGGKVIAENGFNNNRFDGPITLNATLTCDVFYKLTCSNTISGVGGLTKTQTGPMFLSGTNTYTGPTTVTGGTLQCDNVDALGSSALSISTGGAKVNLNYVGTKTIPSLTLGGVAQTIPGTYGSIASGADFQNDTYFAGTGTVTILPSATISVFGTNVIGSSAVISPVVANAATIAWTVPYGTVLANLAPTFTMSHGATCNQTSGAIPSPSFSAGPVVYAVTSSDSLIANAYTVAVTVAPASPAKTLANLYFPGHGYAWASDGTGFNLLMVVPNATNVTTLAPTFSVPLFATCDFPSGTVRNFTTPQTYTVTAQDGSMQAYMVAVQKITTTGSGSYQQKVLASGPVAYWPLDETSGTTAFDRAAGLNPITYGGTLTLNQAGLRTDGNPSVRFTAAAADPANTRAPFSNSLNPREFTVECWIKPADATVQYFLSLQDRTTGGRTGFALWRNNGSTKYGMQIGTGATSTQILNSTTDAVVGTTAHVVATYDGTTLKMYVNGVLENSLVATYQPASAAQPGFTIASRNGVTGAAANIQDAALYTRALTLAEIQSHYQSSIPYATWAATYAGGQPANQDFNNDGVQNGIAYFMGATGIATNPGLNAGNTITWPVSATFSGTYEVQTSPDLSTWTSVVPRPLPVAGSLSYTLPSGLGKQFVRLLVTPTP